MDTLIKLFEQSRFSNFLSFAVSITSLIVAGLALRSSHHTSRRMVEIEEERDKQAGKEAARAKLVAHTRPEGTHQKAIVISNVGAGDARNVQILFDGAAPIDRLNSKSSENIKELLRSQASIVMVYIPTRDKPPPKMIRLAWEDASGETGLYESDLV